MQGTVWRCRGAVRGLRRAGEDFITQSFIDSDHIPGGRRSAQHPHQLPGSAPRACGAPPAVRAGSRAGSPRAALPIPQQPQRRQRGLPAAPCGAAITPNRPVSLLPGREAAATPVADPPGVAEGSEETVLGLAAFPAHLPSPGQPHIPLWGQLLPRSPCVCRARCSQRTHPGEILLRIRVAVW